MFSASVPARPSFPNLLRLSLSSVSSYFRHTVESHPVKQPHCELWFHFTLFSSPTPPARSSCVILGLWEANLTPVWVPIFHAHLCLGARREGGPAVGPTTWKRRRHSSFPIGPVEIVYTSCRLELVGLYRHQSSGMVPVHDGDPQLRVASRHVTGARRLIFLSYPLQRLSPKSPYHLRLC